MLVRKVHRLVAGPDDQGVRLDRFVAEGAELSRTLARKVIDLGGVHVDGRRTRKCGLPMLEGSRVEIHLDGRPLEPFVLSDSLVVFRDRYLLAVNKPAGVETQPTHARYKGTLYQALLDYLHNPWRPTLRPELGMVQRLDRETSGIMIFSTHPRAHKGLTETFGSRSAVKSYRALVCGRLAEPEGEFRTRLAKSRNGNRMVSVDRGGKEAVTLYRTLETFARFSLVEARILTGRTHQIRVHFADAGHPLLGDSRYGGPSVVAGREVPRQMLHAASLSLPHPVTGEQLTLEAPLPVDLAELCAHLRSSECSSGSECHPEQIEQESSR